VEIVGEWNASLQATSRTLRIPAVRCVSILSSTATINLVRSVLGHMFIGVW